MLFQRRNRDILQFRNSFLFQFCHDRDPLLDQRFREAPPSALPFLSGVKMSCNCFLTRSFFMWLFKNLQDMDLKGSVMPLAVKDLINQDSRGIRSSLINLRFFKRKNRSINAHYLHYLFTVFWCFCLFLDLYLPVINLSNDTCKADTDLILSTFKKLYVSSRETSWAARHRRGSLTNR